MSKCKSLIWPKVILFGDSITQGSFQANGWGSAIADKLARKCDVLNRGLSGYNSRWGRIVLPRMVNEEEAGNIAAVTVFFGANDCALQDKNSQQHVPLDEYSENLKAISKYLTAAGVPAGKVIFITPPPIHEAAWEKECKLKGCPLNRLNSVAGQYAQACVQAASHCGADVLDLWTLMQKDGQQRTAGQHGRSTGGMMPGGAPTEQNNREDAWEARRWTTEQNEWDPQCRADPAGTQK
ncbi:isoamyl acetate-hydrolyzing esterase 1 homolog isoform X2 [Corythoichthys intestinalis]|uniref:isoamyl acetate-hydrolyzing esterase 1 homolog isoform X2 n=1 Tax=Corythoichthys intestinalis TaxID=161448 RepID=UPI0025A5580B|nr:isoamyl acetate-hydrolyzing esterase 1 homolog isoform X2 [Corythoichthys intestinalis]